jgi:uncharacterized protein (DUF1800 family)
MRALVTVLISLCACATAPAGAAATLSYDDARHLLNRTGFGATDAEIRRFAGMSREEAARTLLAETRTTALTPPPPWTNQFGPLRYPKGGENAPEAEKKQFQQEQIRDGLELRGWWIEEMLATPSPLTEKMTLFWHNHFVSAQQKVKLAVLMYRQNVTLRENALGNFATLLHAVARDPAMVIYLDKEAARAFTGWSLNRETGRFLLRPFLHDYGEKTVLGRTGNLDGDDVLDLLLSKPETAEFVTRKLWREFVSTDPEEADVKRIAARFRDSRYEIKVVLQALLASDAFYAPENRGTLIKSPVELVVGTMRQFGMRPGETVPFAVAAAGMGQNLFGPPNVKGWPGGEAWINSSTLLARKAFLDRLFRADDAAGRMDSPVAPEMTAAATTTMTDALTPATPAPDATAELARKIKFMRAMDRGLKSVHFDSVQWFATLKASPDGRASAASRVLLAYAPQQDVDPAGEPLTIVRQIVLDDAYQLK